MATSCDPGAQTVIAFDICLGLAVQGQGHVRGRASCDRSAAVFVKPGRGPQQGGQIMLSGGGGRPQPGRFAKPIREHPDQPVVVFGGAGQPDPESQWATFYWVSCLDLPL
jgi:hypothetical protein